ncbi:MAG: enoyl-CoA hydratase-related protein [Syntrophothermus sp.]
MNFDYLICGVSGGIFKITMNRPESLNSLNERMLHELAAAFGYASENAEVRAVVLTGSGRAFSSGQDLKEVLSSDAAGVNAGEMVESRYNPLIRSIRNCSKPVICSVNGIAAGAAANIAFACDIIIAAEEAKFVQSFASIGLIPDSGGTYFLPRLAGLHRAAALMMTAESLPAPEAYRIGLVYRVAAASELEKETEALALKLSSMPTKALGMIKQALNKTFDNSLDEQLQLEAALQDKAGKTGDYKEGIKAFLEKRKPEFNGQ